MHFFFTDQLETPIFYKYQGTVAMIHFLHFLQGWIQRGVHVLNAPFLDRWNPRKALLQGRGTMGGWVPKSLLLQIHPPKSNILVDSQNDGLENTFPFKHGYFVYPC